MDEILIPISFFGACVCVVYFTTQARMKRAKMEHEERMLAMEKGIPVPPRKEQVAKNPYKWPIILIALGIAWLGSSLVQGDDGFLWSLLPLIVGVGLIYAHQKTDRETRQSTSGRMDPDAPKPINFDSKSGAE